MRLVNGSGRSLVVFTVFILFIAIAGPLTSFAQSQEQTPQANIPAIIERAEGFYRKGEAAHARSQLALAREMFDRAVDEILKSGVETKSNARFEAYYKDLLERIYNHEAAPADGNDQKEHAEVVEPSVLDELSDIKESDLAAVTPDGINIYGEYDFNFSVAPPVIQFINYFAVGRGRSTMEVGLKRSGRFREMAERVFKEEGVPLDLIWLAQAESVWKPNALSRAAAKGIWQFIPSTGTRFGLAQTSWVDDRSHPEKSTRAAARYLKWLNDHFAGDWLLAMAAYNSGENRVDRAIATCGYADFWELYRLNLLPQETRNYVPIILSIIIVSKNQDRYGFNITPDPSLRYDTFELPGQTDLKVAADLLSIPYEVVRDLNPQLRRGVSPPDQRYMLKLPNGMKERFEIAYAQLPEDQRIRRVVIPVEEVAEKQYTPSYTTRVATYKVRRGDTLSSLAERHGVSVEELARMNRISARGHLRRGQTIRIPKSVREARGGSKSKARASRYTEKKVRSRSARSAKRGKNETRSRAVKSSRSSRSSKAEKKKSSGSSGKSSRRRH